MRDPHLNGFSALNCPTTLKSHQSLRQAEPQAHFPLHALFLSPILSSGWHLNNTSICLRSGARIDRNRIFTILLNLQIRLS
ncbi:protein YnhH [Buttiauxella sp. WJP83]|uniref:protein YnhH n=1 Tax=Buttiauxella TaxID=82976 RepID=UPI003FA45CE9